MGVPAIVGTCSLCSGAVLFDLEKGKVCRSCGAKAFSPFGPVIEMRPAPQATPSSWAKVTAKANPTYYDYCGVCGAAPGVGHRSKCIFDGLVNRDDSAGRCARCTHCGTTSAQHDTTCPNGTTTNGGPRNG